MALTLPANSGNLFASKGAFAALARALFDKNEPEVRHQIVERLAKDSTNGKLAALNGEDRSEDLVKALIYALKQVKLGPSPELSRKLKAADEELLRADIELKAAFQFKSGSAHPKLSMAKTRAKLARDRARAEVSDSKEERWNVETKKADVFVTVLSGIGNRAVPDVTEELRTPSNHPLSRWVAATALGEIGIDDDGAIQALKLARQIDDPDLLPIRGAAEAAITKLLKKTK